jgi:pilus assembly protein CpaB
MTLRTVLIVVLAVVFGVAAAVYATNVVTKGRETRSVEKIPIVITVKAVPRGTHLTADMLDLRNIAAEDAPADALHSIEDVTRNGGRVTAVELVKGDTVLDGKLAKEGAKEGMAPLIHKDENGNVMQAVTILTPTASAGVGSFIRPGDRVDVLVTIEHFTADDKGSATKRLMQRVEVLATDHRLEAAPSTIEGKVVEQREVRYVTLLVTPRQAQEVALAQKQGTLSLSLRNPEDTTVLPSDVVTAADLKLIKPMEKKPDGTPAATTKVEERPALPPPIRIHRGGAESP